MLFLGSIDWCWVAYQHSQGFCFRDRTKRRSMEDWFSARSTLALLILSFGYFGILKYILPLSISLPVPLAQYALSSLPFFPLWDDVYVSLLIELSRQGILAILLEHKFRLILDSFYLYQDDNGDIASYFLHSTFPVKFLL